MMNEYTVTGSPEEMPAMLSYQGLLDHVAFYYSYKPGQDERRWRKIVEAFTS